MNLKVEQIFVATKLMRWKENGSCGGHPVFENEDGGNIFDWNPQSERKWWGDIWKKLNEKFWDKRDNSLKQNYITNLKYLIVMNPMREPQKWEWEFELHAAKPEVCWEALIKTLKG